MSQLFNWIWFLFLSRRDKLWRPQLKRVPDPTTRWFTSLVLHAHYYTNIYCPPPPPLPNSCLWCEYVPVCIRGIHDLCMIVCMPQFGISGHGGPDWGGHTFIFNINGGVILLFLISVGGSYIENRLSENFNRPPHLINNDRPLMHTYTWNIIPSLCLEPLHRRNTSTST